MRLRFLALLTASAAWVLPARAQTTLELAPFVGGTLYLSGLPERFALSRGDAAPILVENGRFEDAFTAGLTAGVRLGERFAIEAMLSWLPTRLSGDGVPGEMDVNGYMYGGSVTYFLPFVWWAEPFFGVGVGGETYDYAAEGVEVDTEMMGNMYAGIHYPLGSNMGFRLEMRDCITWFDPEIVGEDTAPQNDLMMTLGLVFRIPLTG